MCILNKIGIRSQGFFSIGDNPLESFKVMRSYGFVCADFSLFSNTKTSLFEADEKEFTDYLRFIKDCAHQAGISFNKAHAPWEAPLRYATPEERAERFDKTVRAIKGCVAIDCPNLVVHPIMPFGHLNNPNPEEFYRLNVEFFSELIKVAEEHKIVLCLENMPFKELTLSTPADILSFVKKFDSPYFKVCLDTGHAAVFGISLGDAVRQIGKEYLATLHIHDNDGIDDLHLPVFCGVIDWEDFRTALREIEFDGTISLEIRVQLEKFSSEDIESAKRTPEELAKSALWLADI